MHGQKAYTESKLKGQKFQTYTNGTNIRCYGKNRLQSHKNVNSPPNSQPMQAKHQHKAVQELKCTCAREMQSIPSYHIELQTASRRKKLVVQ